VGVLIAAISHLASIFSLFSEWIFKQQAVGTSHSGVKLYLKLSLDSADT
jgi:hypothetical protein